MSACNTPCCGVCWAWRQVGAEPEQQVVAPADYSGFKFNLGGRINLLYCFFWGIAAVTWIRYGYPLVAKGMKAVKRRIRPWMTALLAVFMAVNLVTSALALARYDARTSGAAPANAVDVLLDEHFDNARMERIYPNAKKVEKAG